MLSAMSCLREASWPCVLRSDGGVIVKQNGKYRFSLQFKADSNANIAAGELLERLGNRKSAVVVAALNDYISVHPEIAAGTTKISVKIESEVKRESLEEKLKSGAGWISLDYTSRV